LAVAVHRPRGRVPRKAKRGGFGAGDGGGRAETRPGGGRGCALHARPARRRGQTDARGSILGAGRSGRVGARAAGPVPARPRTRRGAVARTRLEGGSGCRGGRGTRPGGTSAAILFE